VYGQPSPGQSKPQVRNNEQYFLTFICLEVAFLAGFLLLLTNAYFYDSIQGAVFSLFLLILLAADSAIALALIHKAISETSPLSKDA
jgi:NADH:ubiquinone oxidoreductase subunit K